MPTAYAKAWIGGSDGEHNERCPVDYTNHCGGWVHHSNRVARTRRGRQTRARCTNICSGLIEYASGKAGNPCDGANKIRHINNAENLQSGAHAALECTYNSIDANKLRMISGNAKNVNSTMDQKGSVYEQLLFGIRVGGYNTEGQGFCENANNLQKVVDKNGDTCYKKIVKKLGDAVAKGEGIKYCQTNKTDPKCKCINVSGSGFVEQCRQNPTWAGCSEIIAAADSYASVGVLQSITGLSGGADCLVPGICSGDVYAPLTVPQSCANQIGICDQVLNIEVGKIEEAADLSAFQGCDIQFQTVRDQANSTSGSPAGIPSRIDDSGDSGDSGKSGVIRSLLPQKIQSYVPSDTYLGIGGVGLSGMCFVCILLLLLIAMSSGGQTGRFRRR